MPTDTIFAFLMLNTPRSTHNKILGAKFLSFERLEAMCLYTVYYAVLRTKRYETRLANEPLFSAIEPLLHSNTVTFVIQYSLFYTLIVALSEYKRGCIVKRWCCFVQQNAVKTVNHNSKINFYFVTCFYSFVQYLHRRTFIKRIMLSAVYISMLRKDISIKSPMDYPG